MKFGISAKLNSVAFHESAVFISVVGFILTAVDEIL